MRFCGRCGTRLKRVCPACNFANPPDYRFCGMCGAPLPQEPAPPQPPQAASPVEVLPAGELSSSPESAPIPLEGERRQATVLLADVFGSTNLLEQIGTEAWVAMMHRVLQILEVEVYRFGGHVDQFRGDGLLAFFGAGSAHKDDPERAVLSALRIQEALKSEASQLAGNRGFNLQVRVGVNTGEVIVATIGDSRLYRENTVMGEAVALAARLEAAAEPGTVLVSENTYRLVSTQFEWQSLGEIRLKGLSQSVRVYRPLAYLASAAGPPRLGADRLATPLIGREAEFQLLESRLHDLDAGRGGIVMVTGEEGLGKSLLVNDVRQHIIRDYVLLNEAHDHESNGPVTPLSSLAWLQGRCRSYNQATPYSMWLDLLHNWLDLRGGEPETERRDRLYRQTEALWGDGLADYYPYLATFLALPLEEPYAERVRHLDAGGLRQQFYCTIQAWVAAMTRQGPLVLVFNDVHWADVTSLNLLEYCLPLCDYEPLLWLFLYRPERTSAVWHFRQRVETEYPHRLSILTLSPLTEAQSGEMIDHLIGPNVLPETTRALILNQAEGNPYYIEELIHTLIEQEALVQDTHTGQWRATRAVASIELPGTLQSLLLERIDSLSAGERRILQMAAVVGSTFWSNVLSALLGDDPGLQQHLTALQRAQLILERGQVAHLGMEYAFKSKLMRDTAYASILSHQRVGQHRQVAEILEQQFDQLVPMQHVGLLAYHYRRAEEPGKELFYTLLAAQQAARIYANTEALELYTRALEVLEQMEAETDDPHRLYIIYTQRFEVLDERAAVFHLIGDFAAARADAQALLPLAQQMADDPAWLIDALLHQPGVQNWTSHEELNAGLATAEQALTLAQQLPDRHREMQCLRIISIQRHFLHDSSWQEAGEYALELARQLNDQRYQVLILTQLGTAYNWSNQADKGMAYLEAALPICRALDDRITEVHLLDQLRLGAERQGDYYRLLVEYLQKALAISRQIGYREAEGNAAVRCGQTQGIYLGDFNGGLALAEQGKRMREHPTGAADALLRIAHIRALQGKQAEALAALEQASQIREQDISDILGGGFRLVSAIVYNTLHDEDHLRLALELAAEAGQLVAGNVLASVQFEMAAACQAAAAHLGLAGYPGTAGADEAERQVHREQALQMSQAALDLFRSVGFVQLIECVSEEILFRHSQTLAINGRDREAAEFLQQAYDEMMRKHDLIPADTPFRQTYLENIPLHRDIRAAYTAAFAKQGRPPPDAPAL
ncbi:MAG: AAA family ATPase [Chloroflexi bacterium]|nr:AAA family ATPase [Chloroflexota bacterium]